MRFEIDYGTPSSIVIDGNASTGLQLAAFDLGSAESREVSRLRPAASGRIVRTRHHDYRHITIVARTQDGPLLLPLDRAAAPGAAATIVMSGHRKYPTVRIVGIGNGIWSDSSQEEYQFGEALTTAQWVVPSGIFESVGLHSESVRPAGVGAVTGRTYNEVHNRFYGWMPSAGEVGLFNAGSTTSWPKLNIYGPITDPKAIHLDTGEFIEFDGLSINAGEFITVDMATRTAYANGIPTNSVLQFVDLTVSRWWGLVPGANRVRLEAASASNPAQMIVAWRDAYL